MLKGLRKRPSYDELINEIDAPFITQYPNRKASEVENSVYMSQLRAGFEEVIEQNNRVLKEKTKEVLLQEAASSSNLSHKDLSIQESAHPPSVVSDHDVQAEDVIETVVRHGQSGVTSVISPPIHIPAKVLQQLSRPGPRGVTHTISPTFHIPAVRPDVNMSSSSSSTKRKDVDEDIEQEMIHELQIEQIQHDTRLHQVLLQLRGEIPDNALDDIMRESTKQGTKRESNSDSEPEEGKPKRKAKATPKKASRPNPDEEPEEGKPTRKARTTRNKASRPNPEADNEPDRTTKRQKKPKAPVKTETIKKDKVIKEKFKHDTDKIVYDTFDEWKKTNRGFLFDQIYKRPGIKNTQYNPK
jgi:myosin heavy subunit